MHKHMNDGFHLFLKSWVGLEAQLFWRRLSSLHGMGASPLSSWLPVYLAAWLLWKTGGSGWETDLLHRLSFSVAVLLRGKDRGTNFSGAFSDHPPSGTCLEEEILGLGAVVGGSHFFLQLEGGVIDYSVTRCPQSPPDRSDFAALEGRK